MDTTVQKTCPSCGIPMAKSYPSYAQGAPVWECNKCKRSEVGTPETKPAAPKKETGEGKTPLQEAPWKGVLVQVNKGSNKASFFFKEEDYNEEALNVVFSTAGKGALLQKSSICMQASTEDVRQWLESILPEELSS